MSDIDFADPLYQAISHLNAAIVQSLPSNDQIIMQHVRDAQALLFSEWCARRASRSVKSELMALHDKTMEMLRAAP